MNLVHDALYSSFHWVGSLLGGGGGASWNALLSASAGVGICLANLAKDQIFL